MIRKDVLVYLKEEGIHQVSSKTGFHEKSIKFSGVFFNPHLLQWIVYFILPTGEKEKAIFRDWEIREKFGDGNNEG